MPKQKKPILVPQPETSNAIRKPSPNFLDIPLELREHIYAELVLNEPSALFPLLLTNHQILGEAKPYLFRQSLAFDGQAELYEWLQTVDRACLRYVVDVQFKLHDIDPERIVGALGKRLRQANITAANSAHAPSGNPYDEACDIEIERLGKAFSFIPNVRHFTILSSTDSDPRPSYHMLVTFSNLLPARFPYLLSLTSQEDFLPLEFVSGLPNIRRICFTGMSTSDPAEVTALFHGLQNLVELEINRLETNSSIRQSELYSRIATTQQCNYAQLIRCISQLETLAFYGEPCDEDDDDEDLEVPEVTSNFLRTLDGRGCPLEKLQVFANVTAPIETEIQKRLATFHTSTLLHVETFHAHLPPLNYLPPSIETLVLWTSESEVDIASSMKTLLAMAREFRQQLPNLAEIHIHLDVEAWDEVEAARASIRQRLAALGINLRWSRWDGGSPK